MTLDEIKNLNKDKCPKFSSFMKNQLPMPGIKKHLDEILNREITVVDYRLRKSVQKSGTECLQMQFIMDNEVCVLFTGSCVLINQIQEAKNNIPFAGTIVKIDRYYSFS
ncbi:MAG: hypothetical protein IJL05_00350 [Alphaproteobacteria bacterium]|nr:hypothetical protein [Alphaproteobacteria bacterium]